MLCGKVGAQEEIVDTCCYMVVLWVVLCGGPDSERHRELEMR